MASLLMIWASRLALILIFVGALLAGPGGVTGMAIEEEHPPQGLDAPAHGFGMARLRLLFTGAVTRVSSWITTAVTGFPRSIWLRLRPPSPPVLPTPDHEVYDPERFSTLPPDVIKQIMDLVGEKNLAGRFACVCKSLKALMMELDLNEVEEDLQFPMDGFN